MLKLGKRLKDLRQENNLTQKQLAQKLGIAQNTLSQFETDKANPSLETLISIAKVFNVSIDNILGISSTYENDTLIILTQEERYLLNKYHQFSAKERITFKNFFYQYLKQQNNNEK